MNQHLQNILNLIQQSECLGDSIRKDINGAIKEVDKSLTIVEFKLDRTEKVKRTTAILLEETIEELELKRKAIEETNQALTKSLAELRAAQTQLIQSEKMASLGELTAGIAHEIQNPLNFVNNFSDVSAELMQEMIEEIQSGNTEDAIQLARSITENLGKINHHGNRADTIVKGMLQHSRSSTGQREMTDINALTEEYIKLAFHGYRGKDNSFNAQIETQFDPEIGLVEVSPQEIGRVLLNILNNAFWATAEKRKQGADTNYEPVIQIQTKKTGENLWITVKDNGTGIHEKIIEKIFQPFFTTKPTGQGTGLGLSLSYDIVKAHGGEMRVVSSEGMGSEFLILLNAKS